MVTQYTAAIREHLADIEEALTADWERTTREADRLRAELADAIDPDTVSRRAHARLVRLKDFTIRRQEETITELRGELREARTAAARYAEVNATLREECRNLARQIAQARGGR